MMNLKARLFNAASQLMSDGSIKDRLSDSYKLHMLKLDPNSILNKEIRSRFDMLTHKLGDEHSCKVMARKLSKKEAEELAVIILEMSMIAHEKNSKFGPKLIEEEDRPKVSIPKFLKKN
jgi:uncharacterized protein YigA (DUF484 family)